MKRYPLRFSQTAGGCFGDYNRYPRMWQTFVRLGNGITVSVICGHGTYSTLGKTYEIQIQQHVRQEHPGLMPDDDPVIGHIPHEDLQRLLNRLAKLPLKRKLRR